MEELTLLVNKRGVIKGKLTRFKSFVRDVTEQNISELPERLRKCELLWDEFDKVQDCIEVLDSSEIQPCERKTFEDSYFQITAHARNILEEDSSNHSNISQANVKLPTIELPNFNGEYENWLSFHDIFHSLVHKNKTLSDIQKFFYLKAALKGEAAEVIHSLEVSAGNYVVAWNLLKTRFENKKLIIHNHVKSLVELQAISKESFISLRKLVDEVKKNLRALKALKQPIEYWDTLLIYLISTKLDVTTRREWEENNNSEDMPDINTFLDFLTKRCNLLETLDSKGTTKVLSHDTSKKGSYSKSTHSKSFLASSYSCPICKESHFIHQCNKFLSMSPKARWVEIKSLRVCWNCLRSGHTGQNCLSGGCKRCGKKHNTLLHDNDFRQEGSGSGSGTQNTNNTQQNANNNRFMETKKVQSNSNASTAENVSSLSTIATNCTLRQHTEVLLSTATIFIINKDGRAHECRALLDSGSQSNFISKNLSEALKLKTYRVNLPVTGISQLSTNITHATNARIQSRFNNFEINASFLILDKITDKLPTVTVNISELNIPDNITLADANFGTPSKIDILLGASIFYDLLCIGQIRLGNGQPMMQKTRLGWVISGSLPADMHNKNKNVICGLTTNELEGQLEKFWRLEECTRNTYSNYSKEERECEELFVNTTSRDDSGRFVVRLPVRDNLQDIGESYESALVRLHLLEKRFAKNSSLKKEYVEFMAEYAELGHMSKVNESQRLCQSKPIYYIPHHAVRKETSITTKLRVVFDASAKSDTGVSLNDTLRVGPSLQEDIFSILVRFRTHSCVIVADVAKMYRQVLVNNDQRDLQRILWRAESDQEVEHFTLNTVTYGTASAAFLAIRCLQQIGLDCQLEFPRASKSITQDFYVDDLLTGSDSVQSTIQLKNDLIQILSSYGFTLRKWISNYEEVLEGTSDKLQGVAHIIADDKIAKTLGLLWDSELDVFRYTVEEDNRNKSITKRFILSTIAKIYDPLGLLGPIITKAKLILQKLWQLKISWDETLPMDVHTTWLQFYGQIQRINDIEIPRHVLCSNVRRIELHCFSDASELAYGTSLYLRSTDSFGIHYVKLLCSKSRVAPLKTVSLPRLELCGALLAAQLAHKVRTTINVKLDDTYFWCDSMIVLSWIAEEARHWKTFVANRVSEIQQLTSTEQWRYVNTSTNPADIISRGANPIQLKHEKLWWQGPPWLLQEREAWPQGNITKLYNIPEERTISHTFVNLKLFDIFERYSSLFRLQRIVAYCIRFMKNCSKHFPKLSGSLSVEELDDAMTRLVRLAQHQAFSRDISNLNQSGVVPKESKILSLKPFLDNNGILRVGGRLSKANIHYDAKHPIILPNKHPLTILIVRSAHHKQLHAGPQALLATIRLRYWLLSGRKTVRSILRTCITCFKAKPNNIKYLMGDLPKDRITPSRPFLNAGVDYAGPFNVKASKIRSNKILKSYLCIFICFVTKAVHLELVSDLSTESFLNCLKRFVSRRGKCKNLYSDNATNFVGANNKLNELSQFLAQKENKSKLIDYCTQDAISWHFIPPRSPHFGGLWESAVKSAKHHIRRVVGDTPLTFEELYTVMTQIEACLNSRPITPLTEDPEDLNPLTPGHFLIGDTLTALPQEDVANYNPTRLTRYHHLVQMVQHFWARWSGEYLTQLQHRCKWRSEQTPIKIGDMVLIKDENLPPLKWSVGRIVDVHRGDDKIIRVASVKTCSGVKKRSVAKLCQLPIETQ